MIAEMVAWAPTTTSRLRVWSRSLPISEMAFSVLDAASSVKSVTVESFVTSLSVNEGTCAPILCSIVPATDTLSLVSCGHVTQETSFHWPAPEWFTKTTLYDHFLAISFHIIGQVWSHDTKVMFSVASYKHLTSSGISVIRATASDICCISDWNILIIDYRWLLPNKSVNKSRNQPINKPINQSIPRREWEVLLVRKA